MFGLIYNSPTIGCFFMSKDYIRFLKNLKAYLSMPLTQIKKENSKYINYIKDKLPDNCIIGSLGDIEIFFLHYNSFEDAKVKFERRTSRINFNNMLVKFSDQNAFMDEDFYDFDQLDYVNKIFITTRKFSSKNTKIVVLEDVWKSGFAKDDIKPSFKRINLKLLLNSMRTH